MSGPCCFAGHLPVSLISEALEKVVLACQLEKAASMDEQHIGLLQIVVRLVVGKMVVRMLFFSAIRRFSDVVHWFRVFPGSAPSEFEHDIVRNSVAIPGSNHQDKSEDMVFDIML